MVIKYDTLYNVGNMNKKYIYYGRNYNESSDICFFTAMCQ